MEAAELRLRQLADEAITNAAHISPEEAFDAAGDVHAVATAFVLAGRIDAATARIYQEAVYDGVALRIGEVPNLPIVPDLAFVHRAATDKDLRLHGVVGVDKQLRVPPWPPFAITTVELWNDRTIVRFGGTEHHPGVQVVDGAGNVKPVTWSATGAGFGGAWETEPVDPTTTDTLAILPAGNDGEPGLDVDLTGMVTPTTAPPIDGNELTVEDVVDRMAEKLLVDVSGDAATERNVNRIARQTRTVAAELGATTRAPDQVAAVLNDLGWPPHDPTNLPEPDPAWLALANSSWSNARFRHARPLAIELAHGGVTVTAMEDWTTVWVLRVRTPVDRWEAFLASRWRATDADGNVHAGWAGGPIDGTRVVMQPAPPSRTAPTTLEVLLDGRRYEVGL